MIRKNYFSHHILGVRHSIDVNQGICRSSGELKSPVNVMCRLRTTLCLQYKPHYIAAGSIFLAATVLQNMELLTKKRKVWWLEFEVAPKQLKGLS